jgi:hypothetical protein
MLWSGFSYFGYDRGCGYKPFLQNLAGGTHGFIAIFMLALIKVFPCFLPSTSYSEFYG